MGKVPVLPLFVAASWGLVVSSDPKEVCSSLRELSAWEAPLVTVPVASVIRVVTLISGVVSGDLVSGSPTVVSESLAVVSGNSTVISGSLVVLSGWLTVVSGNPVVVSGDPVMLVVEPVVVSGGKVVVS